MDTLNKLKDELKQDNYDLIKMGKIRFITIEYENLSITEIIELQYENLYLYHTDCEETLITIEGLSELKNEELEHFEHFMKDYFYYGYPFYNIDDDAEMTECEMAFESDNYITEIKTIKH